MIGTDSSSTSRGHRPSRSISLRQRFAAQLDRTWNSWRRRAVAMEAASATSRNGTRRRTSVLLVGGVAALGGMFSLVSANVLAVNFTTGDSSFAVFSDEVVGANAAGFVTAQQKKSGTVGVAQVAFKTATVNGLCMVATQDLPVIGTVSLLISAGEKVDGNVTSTSANQIKASFLYLAADALTGAGKNISGLTLGQSADTVSMGGTPLPSGQTGAPGAFGLQAEQLDLLNLDANTYGVNLEGSINLPNLNISVKPGTQTKADCP